jgi:hypothetical protein
MACAARKAKMTNAIGMAEIAAASAGVHLFPTALRWRFGGEWDKRLIGFEFPALIGAPHPSPSESPGGSW